MRRRVITMQYQGAANKGETPDTYADKVVKYIPSDVVAAWVPVSGIVRGAASDINATVVMWVAFVVGVVVTAAWTWKQTRVAGMTTPTKQILISTCAFGVWVIALGAPFNLNPVIGSLLLIGYTLVVGLFDPG